MILRTKRKIDHYLGLALANFFEFCAYLTGIVLKRKHKDAPVDRVLVMKFSGIGSLACAYPALLSLKQNYPEARIAFWGTRQTTLFAGELGIFSQIIVLDDSTLFRSVLSLTKNLARIWAFRPTWAFDLEIYSKLSSIFCLWTLALNRVGFISDTTRFRRYLHTHLIYFNRFRYVGDLYFRIFQDVIPIITNPATDIVKELGINTRPRSQNHIIVNINTGDLSPMRRWSREHFSLLIVKLLEAYPYEIILTGTGQDCSYVNGLEERLPMWAKARVRNACGKYDLRGLMHLLKGSKLVVTSDSGPMHIAVLMGTPVVAIFGPTHPSHFLPSTRKDIIAIYHDFICSPCVHVIDDEFLPCDGEATCISSISVEEVFTAAQNLLSNSKDERQLERHVYGSAKTYSRE